MAKKRRRSLGAVSIPGVGPVKRGVVVKLRDSNGRLTGRKGIVVGVQKASRYSRAYGKQVFVCDFVSGGAGVGVKGAGDLYPIGKTKRIPADCKDALRAFKRDHGG